MGKNLLTEGAPCNFLMTVQKSHQPPPLPRKNERSLNVLDYFEPLDIIINHCTELIVSPEILRRERLLLVYFIPCCPTVFKSAQVVTFPRAVSVCFCSAWYFAMSVFFLGKLLFPKFSGQNIDLYFHTYDCPRIFHPFRRSKNYLFILFIATKLASNAKKVESMYAFS